MALQHNSARGDTSQHIKRLKYDTTGSVATCDPLSTYSSLVKEDNHIGEPSRYHIKDRRKGLFVLFSHEKIMRKPDRLGNSADEKNIENVWTKLGFEVKTHRNLSYQEIKSKINEYSEDSYHEAYDAFFCAVLTHGEKGDWLWARDAAYNVDDLTRPFQACKSLFQKPKVFLIQACRGDCYDDGNNVKNCSRIQCDSVPMREKISLRVPKEADFLIAYATPPGYYAWRNEEKGSWFIQILCECVEKYAHKWDLMSILTQVNREVAEKESRMSEKQYDGKKQCCSTVSRLTALLYLFPDKTASPLMEESLAKSQCEPNCKVEGQHEMAMQANSHSKVEEQYEIDVQAKSQYGTSLNLEEKGKGCLQLERDLTRKKMEDLALKKQLYEMKLNAST